MKIIKITIAALLVLAVAALAGVGRPEAASSASDDAREGITVTGTGHAKTVPDEAEFSLGVTTKGETARVALSENSAQTQRLIAALKGAGVAERDIRTQHVSVGPGYDGSGRQSGYSAHNTVSVVIRELDRAGAVLDAAARAGATDVYGPSLSRSDRESFEAKALKDAVANARTRASALAEAAGVSLGEVTAIVESSQPQPGPFYEAAGRAVADTKAPIEPGTEEVTAVVTVTFAIS
jgi:uncharacterized protein YggE